MMTNDGTMLQQFCVNWILATDYALASDGDSENNRPKIADENKNFCANFVISISYSPFALHNHPTGRRGEMSMEIPRPSGTVR